MMNRALLSLGSNIEDREAYLYHALQALEKQGIRITDVSSIYETEPVGYTDQHSFLNMVTEIETSFTPQKLLEKTQEIEQLLGRKREVRWGPRTIDLDILLYNQENIDLEDLIIPHPRMTERGFVMIPLNEITPKTIIPTTNKQVRSYLRDLEDKEGVHLWKQKCTEGEYGLFES
ncbi:2-amino-4-hydroxy-6-hydroxymethyldihydropteridine diphosphokinase [Pseudalkalibacillus caeni]|uniref:2-amino-4-hydroxy-6-hydroxymethyldihydropteridine diphosphokinase n=1 Tax=Exobacillus caeni TaxID=2574798 RepID=A0A5R9EVB3_9BACL|nr:2-amino-4-hydroxy-6-hydroxymethyldihydropteridine diphosphokinase [Pseudalkalibacillus caeni]TLS34997.1 2-amino-4-hydroxy-6-hydroxymethyldihydropteridine diphosphokinase [Pseudalkalibacillus caeni]